MRAAYIWQTLAITKIQWSSVPLSCRGTDHISKPRKGLEMINTAQKKNLLKNQRSYLHRNTFYHLPYISYFIFLLITNIHSSSRSSCPLMSLTNLSNTVSMSCQESSPSELLCCLKSVHHYDTSKFSSKWCSPHGALWSWNLTCQWCNQPGSDAPKDEGPHLHHCRRCHLHEILTVQMPTDLWKWMNKFALMMPMQNPKHTVMPNKTTQPLNSSIKWLSVIHRDNIFSGNHP